jgi:hypothetical protein
MSYSLSQFENDLQNSLTALDNNFTTFGALTPIPCTLTGTNTIVLTQNAAGVVPSVVLSAYTTNVLFTGIAAATNTGPATAAAGTLPALPVYKDGASGPVPLTGGEIVAANAVSFRYDVALNSGGGGFHLTSSTATNGAAISPSAVRINGNSTLTNLSSGNSPTLTFSVTPGWSSQDQTFSITAALASALPAVGDFMMVNPPSLGASGVDFRGFVTGLGAFSVSLGTGSLATLFTTTSVATLNIRLLNAASASLAGSSGIYRWAAIRSVP